MELQQITLVELQLVVQFDEVQEHEQMEAMLFLLVGLVVDDKDISHL